MSASCYQLTIQDPPTKLAYVATYNVGNLTSILQSCCQASETTAFSSVTLSVGHCFRYCTVSAPGLTPEKANNCVIEEAHKQGIDAVKTAWAKKVDEKAQKKSGASTNTNNPKLGWMIMGLVAAWVVIGDVL
jgi:hypothetical protein